MATKSVGVSAVEAGLLADLAFLPRAERDATRRGRRSLSAPRSSAPIWQRGRPRAMTQARKPQPCSWKVRGCSRSATGRATGRRTTTTATEKSWRSWGLGIANPVEKRSTLSHGPACPHGAHPTRGPIDAEALYAGKDTLAMSSPSRTEVARRGLPKKAAIQYLGLKRRVFEQLVGELHPFRAGTSLLYDVRDLDVLFDRLKRPSSPSTPTETAHGDTGLAGIRTIQSGVSSTVDRRPSEKGVGKWVVKAASMRTPEAGGGLTESTAVNAFKAVSTRIRMQKPG